MNAIIRAILALGAGLACVSAFAQDFPNKPVRLVVPFPPGGPLDVSGRLIARDLQERWGQSVIVDNKAGSTLGPDFLAKSAPDGYTLMIISSSPLITLPHMTKSSYDPLKDFVGIMQTVGLTYALGVHPATGITSIQQLVAEARKAPGKINYSTGGVGSGQHLYVELLSLAAGIQLTQIPYKGAGPALQALLAGEVQMMLDVSSGIIPALKAGKVNALMVTGAKPLEQLPGVVTFESLYPGVDITSWHGIFAPAGVPRAVQEKLAGDIRRALEAPLVGSRLRELGFEISGVAGDAFNTIVRRDYERWGEVIRKNKITIN
ncbi:MAG: Bug family tripartite tricarboxylate transporter substrate binding protein [Burkholderiales bacterium]